MHIMIDLETLSTASNALILSIGAARFDPLGDGIVDSFHIGIDYSDCVKPFRNKFDIDPATVRWWMSADQALARQALNELHRVDLASAVEGFHLWYGAKEQPVWGNGAAFDNVILKHLFEMLGMDPPWDYRLDRCFRTLRKLAPAVMPVDYGTAHDALSDAIAQALHMQAIVKHLNLTRVD